jgi:hypothetical protein
MPYGISPAKYSVQTPRPCGIVDHVVRQAELAKLVTGNNPVLPLCLGRYRPFIPSGVRRPSHSQIRHTGSEFAPLLGLEMRSLGPAYAGPIS